MAKGDKEMTSPIEATQEVKEKVKLSTQVRMPVELYAKVESTAKAQNQTPGEFIRGLVANHFGFTLAAAPSRAKKYASEEEKKAANKARRDERRDLIKNLLAEYQKSQAGATSESA